MELLQAVMQVNKHQPMEIIARLKKHFSTLDGVRVGVLGLAFKPGTDDMRESPAIPIIHSLIKQGAKVRAYDPVANQEAQHHLGETDIKYCNGLQEVAEDADAILLLTRWSEFSEIQQIIEKKNPQPVLVDGRRMLEKQNITRYEGIGM